MVFFNLNDIHFFLSFWEKYPCNGHAFLKTMKMWDIYRTYYWWTIDAVLSRKLMWARNDNKFSPYISNAIHFSKFKLNTWFFFISNSNFVSFLLVPNSIVLFQEHVSCKTLTIFHFKLLIMFLTTEYSTKIKINAQLFKNLIVYYWLSRRNLMKTG